MSRSGTEASQKRLVMAVVSFYLVAALSMVVANKWVLNSTSTPLFFLLAQLLVAVVLFWISDILRLLPARLTVDFEVCRKLIPLVTLNVLGLSLSNYTLKYVDASFYQVARGLVLPFTVCISGIVLKTRPSLRILLACAVVTFGFFVGVFLDQTNVSYLGVGFGVASSVVTALQSVVTKRSLAVVNDSALELSWYMNLLSAMILLPISLFAESTEIIKLLSRADELLHYEGRISDLRRFCVGSLITGGLGFLMNVAALLSIKVTSPITHMISSAVRGVAASILGKIFFQDIITVGRAVSIAVILAGSIQYTWEKNKEAPTPKRKEPDYERLELEDVDSTSESRRD